MPETPRTLRPGAVPPDLQAALTATEVEPENDLCWEDLEEIAAKHEQPEEVAELYKVVLSRDLSRDVAERLAQRAVRFHDEWFDDPAPLIDVLERLLAIDPTVPWAFERITLLYTVAERWDELLGLYDRTLAGEKDATRRKELLDEAAHVAKDFAAQPDRAIRYLEQLVPLRPSDAQLAASLERLLEARGRHADLIALWTSRLPVLSHDAAQATRLRIATCHLTALQNPADALAMLELLLAGKGEESAAMPMLERIGGLASADPDVRKRALDVARARYVAEGKDADVIRVVLAALPLGTPAEQIAAHRDVAARLAKAGQDAASMEHFAAILLLDAGDQVARAELAELAERTGQHEAHAAALVSASDAARDRALAATLLVEAAEVRRSAVHDEAGAAALFLRAFEDPAASTELLRTVGARLDELLTRSGRASELARVLDRRADVAETPADRRVLLGREAALAEELGELDRALAAWEKRIADDASDREAQSATVALLSRLDRPSALVAALRRRATGGEGDERRADLVRIAEVTATELLDVDAAIAVWREVEKGHGLAADVVDALTRLLFAAERWAELEALLAASAPAETDPARKAKGLALLGDVLRDHLGRPKDAAAQYGAALVVDPAHAGARRGLSALLAEPSCAGVAVAALVASYDATGEWREKLTLVDARLALSEDDDARALVLLEAAALHEQRGEDPAAALDAVGRAFALSPMDASIEAEVVRLARETGRHDVAADAYGRAVAACHDAARAAELRLRLGAIHETELGDGASALAAYEAVESADPRRVDAARAVVRVAGRLGRWGRAASALLASATARDELDPGLLAALETAATEAAAFGPVAVAVADAVHAAPPPSGVAHKILHAVAGWYRDHLGDPASAEEALVAALSHVPDAEISLLELVALRRANPGKPLVEALLRLAKVTGVIAPLREAADVAATRLDRAVAAPILAELYERSSAAFRRGDPGHWEDHTAFAIDRIVDAAEADGEHARAATLLAEGASLPFPRGIARSLLHRAAAIAAGPLGDTERAVALYREILAEDPQDQDAMENLAAIFRTTARLGDLVALRREELSRADAPERRLALRRDLARALEDLGERDAAITALRESLAEAPGDPETVEALAHALEGGDRQQELAAVLGEQAEAVASSDEERAITLWRRQAEVAEERLGDPPLAIAALSRIVARRPDPEALDALSRLSSAEGDHAAAVGYLDRRLAGAHAVERGDVVLRLARALVAAGQSARARTVLEEAHAADAHDRDVRGLLADLYRRERAWQPLVSLLTLAVDAEEDRGARLALLAEVAEIQQKRLSAPGDAVATLERAAALAPEERSVRAALADALRGAGRLEQARQILEGLVEEYGRRRPAERAVLHLHLAEVARARGELKEALAQLDLAASMDMGHAGVLSLLGHLAAEAGQIERAERAYRALLLIVRRQKPEALAAPSAVGQAETLFALHTIAGRLGDEARAKELLESAFETASQNELEAERLERGLREAGRADLLLRALESRLSRAAGTSAEAALLAELGAALESLGRGEEALPRLLSAVRLSPSSDALHRDARELARRTGHVDRYAATLEEVASQVDGDARTELLLRLGDVAELDLGDLARAKRVFGELLDGPRALDACRALLRVAIASGDRAAEVTALRRIVDADADVPEEERTEALYRLAARELADDDTRAAGLRTLASALDRDPQHERAAGMLRKAADSSDDAEVLGAYERIARATGNPRTLLDALTRLTAVSFDGWSGPESIGPVSRGGGDAIREAVELALGLGESEAAESLLRRAVERATESELGLSSAVWALTGLAERRRAAADLAGAARWLEQAAEAADVGESFALWLEVAALAAGELADLGLAARSYEKLLERDPAERGAWEPLLDVYRRMGQVARLEELIARTVDAVYDPKDRRTLRLERARLLLSSNRDEDAAAVLQDMLGDDPDDVDAAELLADVLSRGGRTEELSDLLTRQLDAARARGDARAVSSLTLRIVDLAGFGGLAGVTPRPDAREGIIDLLRGSLDVAPDDRALLTRLLGMLGLGDDPLDRADVMERLLAVETAEAAPALGEALAALRQELGDEDGVTRALALAHGRAPDHAPTRDRLSAWYAAREAWPELTELLGSVAARETDPQAAVARYREIASLYSTRLGDPGRAADTLRAARKLSPEDGALLSELVQVLDASGDRGAAEEELSRALEGTEGTRRAELLRLRAWLSLRHADDVSAIADLEEALALGDPAASAELSAALFERLRRTAEQGDADGERAATLRLVALVGPSDPAQAEALLLAWTERQPTDQEALRELVSRARANEHWDTVLSTCARLVRVETGDAQIAAALGLADAAGRLGRGDEARPALEQVFHAHPGNADVRAHLRTLYEQTGASRELAALQIAEAESTDDPTIKFQRLRDAGETLLVRSEDPAAAIPPLEAALALHPGDHETTVHLADAYTLTGRLDQATSLVDAAVAAHKGRRSRELAVLQHRMARVAYAAGDRNVEMAWLNVALDADMQNGAVASELAVVATELGQLEIAQKALRAVTMLKQPGPMSKAMAYLRQGMIAHHQGDPRRAALLTRKALSEDPQLGEAREFLTQLGEK